MKNGLREKFLVPTILLILIGLSITSYMSYRNSRGMLVDTVNDQLRQNTQSILDFIVLWAENRKQDVGLWSAQSNIVQAAAMTADGAVSTVFINEVNGDLRKYAKAHPDYAEIGLADRDGVVLTTNLVDMEADEARRREGGGSLFNKDVSAEDFFKEAMQGALFIGDVRLDPDTGKPVFVIAAPVVNMVYNGTDTSVGVLYVKVDVEFLSRQFIEPVKIGQQGYAYIVDREGTVISHPEKSRILKDTIASKPIGAELRSRKEGLSEHSEAGQEWLVGFKTDEASGWTVVALASMSELLSPVRSLAFLNFVMTVIILVIAIGVIIYVAARVSSPINAITSSLYMVARQVAGAATQISSASQQLAQGASAQASSIEETSASLEELASMANHNADNARQASAFSQEATEAADSGADAMGKLLQSMEGISTSSSEVAKVAKGIEEIAFQTNLLALNAAVEAARAGEAGRGFAVVADEVRNLAQRASEQARVTSSLITDSSNRTREGSQQAVEANKVLQVIQERVARVVGLVSEISAASKEQAQGVEQINKAVSTMEQIVQQNSANSEQSASASEELSAQAFQMKELVGTLSERVAGTRGGMDAADDGHERQRLSKPDTRKPERHSTMLPSGGKKAAQDDARAEDLIPFDEDDDDELRDF